jgi:hypothetical protein
MPWEGLGRSGEGRGGCGKVGEAQSKVGIRIRIMGQNKNNYAVWCDYE